MNSINCFGDSYSQVYSPWAHDMHRIFHVFNSAVDTPMHTTAMRANTGPLLFPMIRPLQCELKSGSKCVPPKSLLPPTPLLNSSLLSPTLSPTSPTYTQIPNPT